MKKQLTMIIAGGILSLLVIAAFLFPIAPGIVRAAGGINETFAGYDFIFTNDAAAISKTGVTGLITAFVFLIIGASFGVLGTIIPLTGSTKFSGFLDIVAGLCLTVTGVLFCLALVLAKDNLAVINNGTYSLGYGFLIAGLAALVAGLGFGVIGFVGMRGKN